MGTIVTESVEDMIDKDESLEKNNKQKEYLEYIRVHKLNVLKAFNDFFLPLLSEDKVNLSQLVSDEELKEAIKKCSINILDHDASKYSDDEFDGYRLKYYPTSVEKAREDYERMAEEKSEEAWVSHYKNNGHHTLYWKDEATGEIKDMQLEYIIEMLCDWCSFSLKDGDISELYKWYEKADKEKSQMTDRTRTIAEELMNNFIR